MNSRNYIDIIKKRIETVVKEDRHKVTIDHQYFESLLPRILETIKTISNQFGYPSIDDDLWISYFKTAKDDYRSVNPIVIDPSSSLTKSGYETWLTENRKKEIDWNYSERYFEYLMQSGRSANVVKETKKSSLKILEKLGDPKSTTSFYVKGLVVGSVQSGKTGNFNAVINGALDSGYSLILVLSGLYGDLRSQTQKRIENDVIGTGIIDIEKNTRGSVGVGKIKKFGTVNNIKQVQAITSYQSDFTKSLVDADFVPDAQLSILVCKKNTTVLKNLIIWLHDYLEDDNKKHKMPLLILDDEADNASLNNSGSKGRNYASKINGHIRALLDLFEKRSYLGYTATPFANVLQDRNGQPENDWIIPYKFKGEKVEKKISQVSNIFPDDFIVLLKSPSNYIGAQQIFETIKPIDNKAEEKIPLIELVRDNIEHFPTRVYKNCVSGVIDFKNKDEFERNGGYELFSDYKTYREQTRASKSYDDFPKKLPRSLKESIICFLLTIAVRNSRSLNMINSSLYNPHHTMLVHISRFTKWQIKTQKLISEFINEIKSSIENEDMDSSVFKDCEYIWARYFENIIGNIKEYLPQDYKDEFLTPVSFDTLKKSFLVPVFENLDIKAINSVTKEVLEYPRKNHRKVIAIGGNRLSRGFTLEGLTINYFVRSTNYSDTLLQMGRWFGYRPGYLDCCKLFTTQDLITKFDTTTLVIEELEGEFRKMESKRLTPEKFILRVRKHPGVLKITRPSILKNSKELKWSYQDKLEMTTRFNIKKEKMENVWKELKKNIIPKFKDYETNIGFLEYKTDIKGIKQILKQDNNFDLDTILCMNKFLEKCEIEGKLSNWTVALKISGNAKESIGKGIIKKSELNLPCDIKLAVRRGPKGKTPFRQLLLNEDIFRPTGKSANIMSAGKDFSIILSNESKLRAEVSFKEEKLIEIRKKYPEISEEEALSKITKNIPERVYRECFTDQQGILVIYLFDSYYTFLQTKSNEDEELMKYVHDNRIDLDIPLVGYAIGFPKMDPDPGSVYIKGDYDLDIDDEIDFDEDIEDSELPDDSKEV